MAFHVESLACLTRSNKHTSILKWYLVPHSTYYGTDQWWYWWYWRWYKLRWYLVPHFNGLLFMDGCLQQQRVIQFNPRHHCWIDQSLNQQWENVLEHIAVLDTLCVQYCLSLLKTFMTTRESLLFDELQGFYMLIDELPSKSYEALPSTKKTLVNTHWYDKKFGWILQIDNIDFAYWSCWLYKIDHIYFTKFMT